MSTKPCKSGRMVKRSTVQDGKKIVQSVRVIDLR